jgi:S1-C subfamily serine protease
MRVWAAAGLAVVTAALGAGAALLAVSATDLLDETPTTVVAEAPPPPPGTTPARVPSGRFDPRALYASRAPGVVTIYANLGQEGNSQGSGFVVDREGVILTNAHVITNVADSPSEVRGASAVYVEFTDGERVKAELVGWDLFSDVGVLRVTPADHAVAPVPLGDSSRVVVGEPVAAIGSPFGQQTSLSVGVVSAIGRSIDSLTSTFAVANAIQIDAPINRGNSGGPLLNIRGEVVGINTQILSDNAGGNIGIGFAVPINTAKTISDQLKEKGRVEHAFLGVTGLSITKSMAENLNLPTAEGVLVQQTSGPARKAGVKGGDTPVSIGGADILLGGDVLVAIDGKKVRSMDDVIGVVSSKKPGSEVTLELRRGDQKRSVKVKLGDRPASADSSLQAPGGQQTPP